MRFYVAHDPDRTRRFIVKQGRTTVARNFNSRRSAEKWIREVGETYSVARQQCAVTR